MSLLDYVRGERQRLIIERHLEGKSSSEIAQDIGGLPSSVRRTIRRVKAHAASQGYSPEHDMTHTVPEPYILKGTSTYYDKDGKPTAQWVKTTVAQQQLHQMMLDSVDEAMKEVPKYLAPEFSHKEFNSDVIPWFQIGDAHLGMLAHEAEVGHNFDLKIARQELCVGMQQLIDRSEPCERCVINDLGDFTHYENFAGTTEASGHALDVDTRFPKMVKVYIETMSYIIEAALEKFKYVDVIINQGNHSRTNDIWMRHLLKEKYGSDRCHILDNTSVFIPYRMGNTFVMTHHSDKCKPNRLADVMSTDFHHDWGEAQYRYIDIGHIHHRTAAAEKAGVMIESWNQLAPSDKYAHDGGWRSRSFLSVVYRSKTYGEVGRLTVTAEQVKDNIYGGKQDGRRKVYSVE